MYSVVLAYGSIWDVVVLDAIGILTGISSSVTVHMKGYLISKEPFGSLTVLFVSLYDF